jgi:hypothetical protein
MTRHLSPQEFVDALDNEVPPALGSHLDHCERCREELEEMQGLLTSVASSTDSTEPSPLFWDHFSRRVHAATSGLPASSPERWWRMGWRPIAAVGGLVAAIVLVVLIGSHSGPQIGSPAGSGVTASGESLAFGDEESFNFVVQVASSVPYEEFQQVARPSVDATDAMVGQLTPRERVEFVRLLKAQIGSDD